MLLTTRLSWPAQELMLCPFPPVLPTAGVHDSCTSAATVKVQGGDGSSCPSTCYATPDMKQTCTSPIEGSCLLGTGVVDRDQCSLHSSAHIQEATPSCGLRSCRSLSSNCSTPGFLATPCMALPLDTGPALGQDTQAKGHPAGGTHPPR